MSFDPSKINLGGWKSNLPDDRDYIFMRPPELRILPKVVYLPTVPVKDQGQLGSCVFNGITTQMEMIEMRDQKPIGEFSRLELYYKYRELSGEVMEDTGAYPRQT